MDRLAYGLEDGLDVWREGADVVIDRPGMLCHSANLEARNFAGRGDRPWPQPSPYRSR